MPAALGGDSGAWLEKAAVFPVNCRVEAGAMFFIKTKLVACAVCGKSIAPKERRFVDKNRVTKEERHTHIGCRKAG